MAEIGRLTQKRQRAIVALLATPTIEQAAQRAGVGERTLRRWLDDPVFTAAVQRAEDAAIGAAVRKLVSLTDDALTVLGVTLADSDNAPGVRVRAALGVLDQLVKLRELRNLEERVRSLEERMNDEPGAPR